MRMLALVLAATFLTGCSTSYWESGYVGARVPAAGNSAEPVQIRSVPWDRIDPVLRDLEADVSRSDTPPEDWPPERKADAHTKLMQGLQVQDDPRAVEVLGRSDFATTDKIHPNSASGRAELEAFAAKVGADTVVWSSHSLGMVDTIVERPVNNRRGDYFGGDPAMRATYSDTETMWLPMQMKSERTAYIAFFLRFIRGQ